MLPALLRSWSASGGLALEMSSDTRQHQQAVRIRSPSTTDNRGSSRSRCRGIHQIRIGESRTPCRRHAATGSRSGVRVLLGGRNGLEKRTRWLVDQAVTAVEREKKVNSYEQGCSRGATFSRSEMTTAVVDSVVVPRNGAVDATHVIAQQLLAASLSGGPTFPQSSWLVVLEHAATARGPTGQRAEEQLTSDSVNVG